MDDQERESLIMSVEPFIRMRAIEFHKEFHPRFWTKEDFISVGWQAAVETANKFSPPESSTAEDRKALFVYFATRRIIGAMRDVIRKHRKRNQKLSASVKRFDTVKHKVPMPDEQDTESRKNDLRTEMKKHLTKKEFQLADQFFFRGRTLVSLAPEYGLSPSRLSQKWSEIKEKLKNIPEFIDYLYDQ